MALRGQLVDLARAEGFAAYENGELVGLIAYALSGGQCEILSLQSLRPGRGIGTELMRRAIDRAREAGARRVVLITTNDNTDALRFYQRMGFDLTAFHRNALKTSRRLKPSIPLAGEHGIPIRHELELALSLQGEIEEVKSELCGPEAATLLTASAFDPTPERVAARAEAYRGNPNICAWGMRAMGRLIGLIVVGRGDSGEPAKRDAAKGSPDAWMIRDIAVAEGERRRGVGGALVRHAAWAAGPGALIAETDDDAVDFYRRLGFAIAPLGEVYPGVNRYRCALAPTSGHGGMAII